MIWLASCTFALAHDPGLSTAALTLQEDRIEAVLTFAPADAEFLGPAWEKSLNLLVDDRLLEVSSVGREQRDDNVRVRLSFQRPRGEAVRVRSTLLDRLPSGHRQFFSLRDRHGHILAQALLDARRNGIEINIQESGSNSRMPAGRLLLLGVEHIATGYDHLLFLLALLIVGGGIVSSLKIITSFTVAHSLTLALATLQWIQLEARLVEPLIALSIIYVGVGNLAGSNLDRRWLITFGFGLIHGLGFASVLRELGFGSNGAGVVLPLVCFNLGVELGQLAIAALVLPLIWKLQKRPSLVAAYVPAVSLMVTLLGAWWLVERMPI